MCTTFLFNKRIIQCSGLANVILSFYNHKRFLVYFAMDVAIDADVVHILPELVAPM